MSKRLPIVLLASVLALAQSNTLERAWDLAAKGRSQEAISLLNDLVKKTPGNVEARLLLGNLLMEAGNDVASIAQLSEAVRLRPRSAEAANSLGEAYRSVGDSQSAQRNFERAVSLDSAFGTAQLNLGQALLEAGDPKAAAIHLDRAATALGRKDDAADAHYLRARIYSSEDGPQNASRELEKALAIRPDFAQAWSDLGQTRQQISDDKGAIAAYTKAVAINPKDPVAQYRLGSEYLHVDQPHQALQSLQAANQLNPQDQSTLNALQTALRQDGKVAEANQVKARLAALLRDRDKQNQNSLAAVRLNNEGAALEKSGDLAGALAKYRDAARLAPDHNGIRVNYAVALLRTGQWTEGLNLLHEAAQREPDNLQLQAALRDALSQAPPASRPTWSSPEAH